MAQKTDLELITEANIIRDETAIGANTALRVGTMLDNLIDSKINNDMVSDNTSLGNSTTLVPSQNAVKTYVDAFATGLLTDNGNYDPTITGDYPTSGNTLSGGAVQKGDIWYINADGTINGNSVLIGYSVRALVDNAGVSTDADWSISNVGLGYVPENVANKSTDVNLGTSDIYYPSQNAVKTYVDTEVAAAVPYTPENIANKSQDIISNPSSTVLYPSNKAVADYIAYGIDLQAVTDSGNTTTNDIHILNKIDSSNATDSGAAYLNNVVGDGGIVGIKKANGTTAEIKATNITANRNYEYPDASGTLALTSDIITPTLQNVLAAGHNLINNVNSQGSNAGNSNTGTDLNAFGEYAADGNSGNNINALGSGSASSNTKNDLNALGSNAAYQNTGDSVNALGNTSAFQNSGNNVNALGYNAGNGNTGNEVNIMGYAAGTNNTYNYVNIFGENATADDNNQTVFSSKNGSAPTRYARLSYKNITANRKWELPNASGTLALQSYKVYTALVTQIGTNAPTVIVLENTLGAVTFTYNNNGQYNILSSGLFTVNKTWCNPGYNDVTPLPISIFTTNANNLYLNVASGNDSLYNTPIEIRVYP